MRKLSALSFFILVSFILGGCGYFFGKKKVVKIQNISKKWKEEIKVNIPDNKNVHKLNKT